MFQLGVNLACALAAWNPERFPVTGASGLVGRHFIEEALEGHFIYALARRSSEQSDIPPHPRISWTQADSPAR